MPTLHPSSRRFVPSEIWAESCGLDDIECHASRQIFVLGRCIACEICHCSGENDKIELKACSKCEICDSCGERTAHGDTMIIAIDGVLPHHTDSRAGSIAGCAVFCGINSKYNTTFVNKMGHKHTSPLVQLQRAKFRAIVSALKQAKTRLCGPRTKQGGGGPKKQLKHINEVVIKTDSKYVADSLSIHITKWRSNGYTNVQGLPVVSQDFITQIDGLCDDLANLGVEVRFWRVPEWFNSQANKLAYTAFEDVAKWKSFAADDWFEGGDKPRIH